MYSFTEERAEVVDMAGPYLVVGQEILVRTDSPIQTLQDVAGQRVCVVIGSTQADFFERELGDSDTTFIEEVSSAECVRLVAEGGADAATSDDIILAGFASSEDFRGRVRILGQPLSEEFIMVGLPPGSTELCHQISDAITEMIEDGSWLQFLEHHTQHTDFLPNPALNPPALKPCR
jgi:glutamate transport system substrate-binding protein